MAVIETTLGHIILVSIMCIIAVPMMVAPIMQRVENGHWGPAQFGDEAFYWNLVFWCMARMLLIIWATAMFYAIGYLVWSLFSALFTVPVVLS